MAEIFLLVFLFETLATCYLYLATISYSCAPYTFVLQDLLQGVLLQ